MCTRCFNPELSCLHIITNNSVYQIYIILSMHSWGFPDRHSHSPPLSPNPLYLLSLISSGPVPTLSPANPWTFKKITSMAASDNGTYEPIHTERSAKTL